MKSVGHWRSPAVRPVDRETTRDQQAVQQYMKEKRGANKTIKPQYGKAGGVYTSRGFSSVASPRAHACSRGSPSNSCVCVCVPAYREPVVGRREMRGLTKREEEARRVLRLPGSEGDGKGWRESRAALLRRTRLGGDDTMHTR